MLVHNNNGKKQFLTLFQYRCFKSETRTLFFKSGRKQNSIFLVEEGEIAEKTTLYLNENWKVYFHSHFIIFFQLYFSSVEINTIGWRGVYRRIRQNLNYVASTWRHYIYLCVIKKEYILDWNEAMTRSGKSGKLKKNFQVFRNISHN